MFFVLFCVCWSIKWSVKSVFIFIPGNLSKTDTDRRYSYSTKYNLTVVLHFCWIEPPRGPVWPTGLMFNTPVLDFILLVSDDLLFWNLFSLWPGTKCPTDQHRSTDRRLGTFALGAVFGHKQIFRCALIISPSVLGIKNVCNLLGYRPERHPGTDISISWRKSSKLYTISDLMKLDWSCSDGKTKSAVFELNCSSSQLLPPPVEPLFKRSCALVELHCEPANHSLQP